MLNIENFRYIYIYIGGGHFYRGVNCNKHKIKVTFFIKKSGVDLYTRSTYTWVYRLSIRGGLVHKVDLHMGI